MMQPGSQHTFINRKTGEMDTGVLPSREGDSNEFAVWHSDSKNLKRKPRWSSRKFERARFEAQRLHQIENSKAAGSCSVNAASHFPHHKKGSNQHPSQSYRFINKKTGEVDAGVLPNAYGESNEFAVWHIGSKWCKPRWYSRKFERLRYNKRHRDKVSTEDVKARLTRRLRTARSQASMRGWAPIDSNVTADDVLTQYEKQGRRCGACKGVFSKGKFDGRRAVLDHNHSSGQFRGILHGSCNITEGFLMNLSDEEFRNFLSFITVRRYERYLPNGQVHASVSPPTNSLGG